jgi:hypothetical protein
VGALLLRANLKQAAILALLAAIPAAAQWLAYPTAGVPKAPDGSPNLTAPPPRMPDGKPDLSGIWTMMCPTAKGPVMCLPETYVSREFADTLGALRDRMTMAAPRFERCLASEIPRNPDPPAITIKPEAGGVIHLLKSNSLPEA